MDDSLELLLLCCHPALTRPSQVALTLRAVDGLTTADIARAVLVPEATIAQRISRAKATIARAGARFELCPPTTSWPPGSAPSPQCCTVIFTEGHTASSGGTVGRADLTREAIRLGRLLQARAGVGPALAAHRGELGGLLAPMLLPAGPAAARVGENGNRGALRRAGRSRWGTAGAHLIDEGRRRSNRAVRDSPLGPYQREAGIAAGARRVRLEHRADSTGRRSWCSTSLLVTMLCGVR